MIKRLLIIILCTWSFGLLAQPSVFSDTSIVNKVKTGVDQIYNFQFDDAENIYYELIQQYPDHPFTQLYYAVLMYWKHFPILPDTEQHDIYVGIITKVINNTEVILENNENNSDAVFFNLLARILLMQYYADNNLSSKMIPHVGKVYKMVIKSFDLKNEIDDFYLFTGVYNYYREAYPQAHPIYKPIAYFFPEGDIELGLQQIEYNWQNGIFLEAESLFFLVYINLYFEGNYKQSLIYVNALTKEYPNNPLYLSYKIKILLLEGKYNKAATLNAKLERMPHSNNYFNLVTDIYQAIILEKRFKNYQDAKKLYSGVIKPANKYSDYINNSLSYAYFGLSRIYSQKDNKLSKRFRKQAQGLSTYPLINFD